MSLSLRVLEVELNTSAPEAKESMSSPSLEVVMFGS